jgi:hypothetical protein
MATVHNGSKSAFGVAEVTIQPTIRAKRKDCPARIALFLLYILVAALLLGTIAACIAFGIVISDFNSQLSETDDDINTISSSLGSGLNANVPAVSCATLPPSSPSGLYWVIASNGSIVRVLCNMTLTCGNIQGGWTRVAFLNTSDSSQQCPDTLRDSTDGGIRTCVIDSDVAACPSIQFPSIVLEGFTRICGRIIAYQSRTTDGFLVGLSTMDINSNYVDGVSLTYGSPRQHLWSFASGNLLCPCFPTGSAVPSFVGNDYFCDAGIEGPLPDLPLFVNDPLWDGAGCDTPGNTCCSFNSPPWFQRQLSQPVTDDIEMRVCRDQERADEDVAIEIIELYVQ